MYFFISKRYKKRYYGLILLLVGVFGLTVINEQHCLYVEPSNDPKADFIKQCDKLINWKEEKLTPYALLGLKENEYTKETLHAVKKELLRIFHPDKHTDVNNMCCL
jgi:predicted GNAT family N-acyltransferase